MSRNAKGLGLALAAMLAMSAVGASAASGTAFDAPSGRTKITASQEVKFEHKFTTTGGALNCEFATFVGEASGNGLASIEVVPAYTNCLKAGNAEVVNTNGCNMATGTFDIVCPAGSEITATTTSSTIKCTLHIPAQTGLKSVTYTNFGPTSPTKEMTINFSVSGIKYSQTEGSGFGKCVTANNETNGTYVGKALATGENSAGTAHADIIWTA